jgi:hypothetical protein
MVLTGILSRCYRRNSLSKTSRIIGLRKLEAIAKMMRPADMTKQFTVATIRLPQPLNV